jgi:hypothetical protein
LFPSWNGFASTVLPKGYFDLQERRMKRISYVLAALATIAIAMPSIATAQDKPTTKEGVKSDSMKKPAVHHHRHHHQTKSTTKKEGT